MEHIFTDWMPDLSDAVAKTTASEH